MSRATGTRAYSGRHRFPKIDETSSSIKRTRRAHRVVPPTQEQLVAWMVHCAMRSAPIPYDPKGDRVKAGTYTAAVASIAK